MMPQSRTLTEQEYNAVRQRVLNGLPDGLTREEFPRVVAREMERALGEAENGPRTMNGLRLDEVLPPNDDLTLNSFLHDPVGAAKQFGVDTLHQVSDPRMWLALAAAVLTHQATKPGGFASRALDAGGRVVRAAPDIAEDVFPKVTRGVRRAMDAARGGPPELQQWLKPESPAPTPAAPAPSVEPVAPTSSPAPAARPSLNEAMQSAIRARQTPEAAPVGEVSPPTPSARPATITPRSVEALAPKGVKLTAAEVSQGMKWLRQGVPGPEIMNRIVTAREFSSRFGLPSPETVRQAVSERNATGRWGYSAPGAPQPPE